MLKGKTTIELTDVNSGKVEVIEDTNMITNALQEFMRGYGMWGSNVLLDEKIRTSELWVNLLGGLLLFDTQLEENADNTFMPAGVKMIGNASKDVVNSGAVTELGNYNVTESGVQSDGSIKFVYDFSTSQANGTIKSVCLTSRVGGYEGVGNKENCYINNDYPWDFMYEKNVSYFGNMFGTGSLNAIMYASYQDNAIYLINEQNRVYTAEYASEHWSTTKKIQIMKARAGFTGVSIKSDRTIKEIVETYDVEIPQTILDYMGTSKTELNAFCDFERNIYIMFNNSTSITLKTNAFVWMLKIDRNMNATPYKITNNTGRNLYLNRFFMTINNDYLFIYSDTTPYKLYGIKCSDSTQIIEIDYTWENNRAYLFNFSKNLVGVYGEYSNNDRSYYAPLIFDMEARTLKKTNGRVGNNRLFTVPFVDKKGVYILVNVPERSSDSKSLRIMKDMRYLATINNLTEAVVKTSSKTMKITYTISEV